MNLKLKRSPGLYLVGFMGCGKTTLGELLAEELGWRFIDLDCDIEQAHGTTIASLFETLGEPEFRRLESAALRKRVHEIACGNPTVLALGGGGFVQADNAQLIEEHGITVWLSCPVETLEQRVANAEHRPLARDAQRFRQLFAQREALYRRAEYHVENNGDDPASALAAILKLPIF